MLAVPTTVGVFQGYRVTDAFISTLPAAEETDALKRILLLTIVIHMEPSPLSSKLKRSSRSKSKITHSVRIVTTALCGDSLGQPSHASSVTIGFLQCSPSFTLVIPAQSMMTRISLAMNGPALRAFEIDLR